MIMRRSPCAITGAMLACILSPATAAFAQTAAVAKAKGLYTAAAYDEALSALVRDDSDQAQEYRALCLLALGRADEARQVTESLVTAHPSFTVSDEEAPPRFVAMLTETRRRLLPGVIRKLLSDGRDRFQAKSYGEAKQHFEGVMRLASDPLVKGTQEVADLGVLAGGFLDLIEAAAAAAAKPVAAPAVAPVPVRPPEVVPPVAIRQTIPPCNEFVTRWNGWNRWEPAGASRWTRHASSTWTCSSENCGDDANGGRPTREGRNAADSPPCHAFGGVDDPTAHLASQR
jgi:tetratricopeptide (TPR) repeat protein